MTIVVWLHALISQFYLLTLPEQLRQAATRWGRDLEYFLAPNRNPVSRQVLLLSPLGGQWRLQGSSDHFSSHVWTPLTQLLLSSWPQSLCRRYTCLHKVTSFGELSPCKGFHGLHFGELNSSGHLQRLLMTGAAQACINGFRRRG